MPKGKKIVTPVTRKKDGDRVASLRRFMEARNLKPHPWATAAGIRSSTIYNFLAGSTHSLSTTVLEKLALAAGCSVDEILSGAAQSQPPEVRQPSTIAAPSSRASVEVLWTVGIGGRLHKMEETVTVSRPVGVDPYLSLAAAVIEGDGLHPLRSGWLVYYNRIAVSPEELIGKLAVVIVPGKPQPMIREIARGSQRGLYTLRSWTGAPLEDVEVESAHLVVSICQPG